MPNWNPNDIENQYNRAVKNDWIAAFKQAAADYKFTLPLLMAIASRETNMRSIVGDGGHGYGIMQIDDRSFPDWCHSGQWADVAACIQKGALVLDDKRESIRNGQGKKITIGGKTSFIGKNNLTDAELLQTAVAAYNSGMWAYYGLTKDGDPDGRTTGHDYSKDTYARMAVFAALLK
jgi:hypothetical protein